MQKNKSLLFAYNILTLNILGIILTNKFLKDDNYNYLNLIEETDFLNDESYTKKFTKKAI